jgi:deazaflavin-dependent oxidoreductase (nitroreductase family)
LVKRLLKFLGESGFWKLVGRAHVRAYRASGGRLGANLGGLPHLLLTTVGRKSGQVRTVPLTYMQDGDAYVLVASNGGSDRHPAWWLNLRAAPRANVQVRGDRFEIAAAEAQGAERERLWAAVKKFNPFYAQYEQITDRRIPVVVLRRTP